LRDGENYRLLTFLLEDFTGFLVRGQRAHIELFLLGKATLMELDEENQPNQGGGKDEKAYGVNSDKIAPS
jgi:hypothetical protein